MSDAGHDRFASVFLNAFPDRPTAAEVIQNRNGALSLFGKDVLRNQGGEQVHRNDLALVVYESAAVGVAVEPCAEIRADFHDFGAKGIQSIRMKRICLMIRESSVQFLIKGNDLEQVFDTRDFIRPHGVGIVHDDFELAVHFCVGTEKRPVFLCDIVSGYGSGPLRLRPFIFCNESFDIGNAGGAADRNRLFAADFESVPFCGVVRSCNHDAGICSELAVCVIGHRSSTCPGQ